MRTTCTRAINVCSTVVVAVVEERWVVAAHYSDSCAVLCCGADDVALITFPRTTSPTA